LNWETLAQSIKIAHTCDFFKPDKGERAWKTISDRLQKPCYPSGVDRDRKIRSRKQKTDFGK
jgi:hypothetical protein